MIEEERERRKYTETDILQPDGKLGRRQDHRVTISLLMMEKTK